MRIKRKIKENYVPLPPNKQNNYRINNKIPTKIKHKPNIIPKGRNIFRLMIDDFSVPNIFLHNHAFGPVSIYLFAKAGFIRDLIEKNKLRIPIPIKNKE